MSGEADGARPQILSFSIEVPVSFGDCDPAGIVFYPNFFRWFDACYHRFLESRGFGQRELKARLGTVGTGLIDVGARFRSPARYGDNLTVSMQIVNWTDRTLKLNYRGTVSDRLCVEGHEVRGLFIETEGRIHAAPIAPLRQLLENAGR